MGNFSDKLTHIIVNRKISVGDVVSRSGISRNAFFKHKNGARLPANKDIVVRIADTLCLNRDEYESLIEAYLVDMMGEYLYSQGKSAGHHADLRCDQRGHNAGRCSDL